jgi:hypothetical protein
MGKYLKKNPKGENVLNWHARSLFHKNNKIKKVDLICGNIYNKKKSRNRKK